MTRDLFDALGLRPGTVVSLVGGGGKSTLAVALARLVMERELPVTLTTTTKMGVDQIPSWAAVCLDASGAISIVTSGTPAYLVGTIDGEKVVGVDPGIVDELHAATNATILVEADGARQRPFKAPDEHEPVIPSSTDLVVVVAGVDAIGLPIADAAHRPHRVVALTGRALDDVLRPEDVACVIGHPDGGRKNVPPTARLAVAITKIDDETRWKYDEIRSHLDGDIVAIGLDRDGSEVGTGRP